MVGNVYLANRVGLRRFFREFFSFQESSLSAIKGILLITDFSVILASLYAFLPINFTHGKVICPAQNLVQTRASIELIVGILYLASAYAHSFLSYESSDVAMTEGLLDKEQDGTWYNFTQGLLVKGLPPIYNLAVILTMILMVPISMAMIFVPSCGSVSFSIALFFSHLLSGSVVVISAVKRRKPLPPWAHTPSGWGPLPKVWARIAALVGST